jgi:RimJ/RimL family protein N-acetyltransferase
LVTQDDIEIFFGFMQNKEQLWQAAFTNEDPSDYQAHLLHWQKILANPEIINRTVVVDGVAVGNVGSWPLDGVRQLTFWVGIEHRGKSYASQAVAEFLKLDLTRPMEGRCAFDNLASAKVLTKNGFEQSGTDRYYANARGEEITEFIFQLL